MNKKVILLVIGVLLIIIGFIFSLKGSKQDNTDEIPVYDADIVCTYTGDMLNSSDDNVNYTSNIYITLDGDNISYVISQSIEESNELSQADTDLIKPLINDYNKLKGIKASIKLTDNYLITTVKYDYNLLDLEEIRSELKNVLGDDSVFNKIDELPISYSDYASIELIDYECHQKKN